MKVKKSAITSESIIEVEEREIIETREPRLCLPKSFDAAPVFPETGPYTPVEGCHDMIIAFDTTGSMSAYIDAIRSEVAILIPQLFAGNENLRLGIIAFGDYCDIESCESFGKAFQRIQPTSSISALINFVRTSKDTGGGDGDEFYELVIRKIVDETPWRPNSHRSVLLIADAEPHPLGYSYGRYVINSTIDWRKEAQKAVERHIKFDTVAINNLKWMRELSRITSGISTPFRTSAKTGHLIRAAVLSRGTATARASFDANQKACAKDTELREVYKAYEIERYPSRKGVK